MTGVMNRTTITEISPRRASILTVIIIPAGIGFQAPIGVASECGAMALLAAMRTETGTSSKFFTAAPLLLRKGIEDRIIREKAKDISGNQRRATTGAHQ